MKREDGFTLIEVIFSMAIVGIILTAITGALIVFYNNGTYTTRRDDSSSGSQLLSAYLNRDVASATQVDTAVPSSCPSSVPSSGFLTGFEWQDWTATSQQPSPAPSTGYAAAYGVSQDTQTVRPGNPTLWQIERWYCSSSSGVIDHQVLLRDLSTKPTSSAINASGTCGPNGSSSLFTMTLPAFESDSTAGYSFTGCVGERQQ